MPATDIDNAIQLVNQYVWAKLDIDLAHLLTAFETWQTEMFDVSSFPAPGDALNPGQQVDRNILDWAIPTQHVLDDFYAQSAAGSTSYADTFANQAVEVVARCLYAAQDSLGSGNISAAQGTSITNAFNDAWA